VAQFPALKLAIDATTLVAYFPMHLTAVATGSVSGGERYDNRIHLALDVRSSSTSTMPAVKTSAQDLRHLQL
jgi:hypothetical protein